MTNTPPFLAPEDDLFIERLPTLVMEVLENTTQRLLLLALDHDKSAQLVLKNSVATLLREQYALILPPEGIESGKVKELMCIYDFCYCSQRTI